VAGNGSGEEEPDDGTADHGAADRAELEDAGVDDDVQ
jgi:hypothetical protein